MNKEAELRHSWHVKGVKSLRDTLLLVLLSLALLATSRGVATAADANETNSTASATPTSITPAGPLGFDSFKIIVDRNIFNGNRSGQRIASTRSSSRQRSVQVDSFTLVGTLINGTQRTAFFDGTDSAYRKALKVGDRIAQFEVLEIGYAGVRLLDGSNNLDVRVGSGYKREDNGPWKSSTGGSYASASSGTFSSSQSSQSSSSASISGSSGDSASDGDADEILKRLMERRNSE